MMDRIVVPAHPIDRSAPIALTRKQQALVAFIEHNPKFAAFATTADLAGRVGVHPATVVRLAQMLGYVGFPEFQESIQHRYLASLDAVALMHDRAPDRHGDVSLASIDQDIRNLTTTRSLLDPDALRAVARAILGARGILAVGFGSHAGIAAVFCHLLRFMGLPAEVENRGGVTLATRLTSLGPGDVVIGTSAWWVVRESRETLAVAKEQGATTVAIVDNRLSAMAQLADHVLLSKTESVSYFQSMLGPLAVLNALAVEIASIGEEQVRASMETSSRMFERLGVVWHDVAEIPIQRGDSTDPLRTNRRAAEPVAQ
ncbi:MAG: MurR/RpiR family transcriptional regulator [Thermomicrobiales bacterium]|nr:MurR/RpiR family transcriptional regulator [Thermomicrobiales bacterium]